MTCIGPPQDLLVRLLRHIELAEDGCINWTGHVGHQGYGVFQLTHTPRKMIGAHRLAYILVFGAVPRGLVLDHLCRNRRCVNPVHLEPVTHQVNILRGTGDPARYAIQTHCLRGHALEGSNLSKMSRPERRCRICKNEREARFYRSKRARMAALGLVWPPSKAERRAARSGSATVPDVGTSERP